MKWAGHVAWIGGKKFSLSQKPYREDNTKTSAQMEDNIKMHKMDSIHETSRSIKWEKCADQMSNYTLLKIGFNHGVVFFFKSWSKRSENSTEHLFRFSMHSGLNFVTNSTNRSYENTVSTASVFILIQHRLLSAGVNKSGLPALMSA
jgi:hypothetical protein